jgi:hypothetical protein
MRRVHLPEESRTYLRYKNAVKPPPRAAVRMKETLKRFGRKNCKLVPYVCVNREQSLKFFQGPVAHVKFVGSFRRVGFAPEREQLRSKQRKPRELPDEECVQGSFFKFPMSESCKAKDAR